MRFTLRGFIRNASFLVACLTAGDAYPQEADRLHFAFVTHGGPGNPFWNVVITGMEDAGQRYGVDVQWLSSPTFSIEDMADFLDDAIASGVDGLGVTCPDPDAIRENIERARASGIPVIVLNTADPHAGTPDALPTLFYVGASEFFEGGAGERSRGTGGSRGHRLAAGRLPDPGDRPQRTGGATGRIPQRSRTGGCHRRRTDDLQRHW